MKKKALVGTICLVIFVDAIAGNLVLPLIPFMAIKFSASVVEITSLTAIFALFTFVFSPIIGRLSDRVGRKSIFLGTIFLGALSYAGFAMASDLWVLFALRALGGISAGKVPVAQSIITSITTKEERSKYIGLISASISLGFVVGPLIGGLLGSESYELAFYASAVLCVVGGILGMVVIPGEPATLKSTPAEQKTPRASISELLSTTRILFLLPLFFGIAFANYLVLSIVPFWVYQVRNWNVLDVAYIMAACGIATISTQVGAVPLLAKRTSEWNSMQIGLAFVSLGLVGLIFWGTSLGFYVSIVCFAAGIALANNSAHSIVSIRSPKSRVGQLMGTNQSVRAVGQLTGAMVAGGSYAAFSKTAPFFCAFGLLVVMWLFSQLGKLPEVDAQARAIAD